MYAIKIFGCPPFLRLRLETVASGKKLEFSCASSSYLDKASGFKSLPFQNMRNFIRMHNFRSLDVQKSFCVMDSLLPVFFSNKEENNGFRVFKPVIFVLTC